MLLSVRKTMREGESTVCWAPMFVRVLMLVVSRFFSHSCTPNCSVKCVWGPRRVADENMPEIVIFAARDIDAGEELTISYGFHCPKVDMVRNYLLRILRSPGMVSL